MVLDWSVFVSFSEIANQTRKSNSIPVGYLDSSLPNVNESIRQQHRNQTKIPNSKQTEYFEQSLPTVAADIHQQQRKRLQHLRRACDDEDVFKNVMYNKQSLIVYYFSSRYNFSYCKVHKAGGTFWTQVFAILQKGATADVFRLSKLDVHLQLMPVVKSTYEMVTKHDSRTVLVSRDPYTRLFSAFIDKLFLPISYPVAVGIVKRQRKTKDSCANDITFEEFLTDIIASVREGETLNVHWTPIVNLCKPCGINAFAVVKQETFTADVEYVVKKVGIANDEYEVVHDALHEHRIEANIPGIVATTIKFGKGKGVKKCMDGMELARRLWTAFQIQGYIKDDMPFPSKTISTNEKAENPDFLTKLILETIKKHPLSPDESKLQRRRALVKAFDGLSKDMLDQVKELYRQDFILFDYPFDPPDLPIRVRN